MMTSFISLLATNIIMPFTVFPFHFLQFLSYTDFVVFLLKNLEDGVDRKDNIFHHFYATNLSSKADVGWGYGIITKCCECIKAPRTTLIGRFISQGIWRAADGLLRYSVNRNKQQYLHINSGKNRGLRKIGNYLTMHFKPFGTAKPLNK